MKISLRPVRPGDEKFLFSVYAGTRAEELEPVDWNPAQKDAFLRMQFRAQTQYYSENYLGAVYQLILLNGQPIGRLYIHRRTDEIRIMDIALLPAYRKQGIGSRLLNEILQDAARHNLPVTIHVERFNPALHLYERLGFHLSEDRGVYYFMKWSPAQEETHENIGSIAEQ